MSPPLSEVELVAQGELEADSTVVSDEITKDQGGEQN